MVAGLQVVNDSNVFQIDNSTTSFVLDRIVTCTTSGLVGSQIVSSQGTVTLNSGEVLAIRCNVPAALVSVTGTTAYLRAKGDVGTQITCYIFKAVTSSGAGYGLQIFDANSALMFCATLKPLRFVGFPSGNGDFTYISGRSYASILINQYYKITGDRMYLGGNTVRDTIATERGMVSTINSGIKVSTEFEYYNVSTYTAPTPPGLPPNTTSISQSLNAVIDVTDY